MKKRKKPSAFIYSNDFEKYDYGLKPFKLKLTHDLKRVYGLLSRCDYSPICYNEVPMIKIKRQPTHPGKILREDFLLPVGLSQTELAEMLNTTFRTVNEILNEKRGISPEMAVRLARFFGTSEELWLNLQDQYDLYKVKDKKQADLWKIIPYKQLSKTA